MLRWFVLGVFALLAWLGAAQAQESVEPLTLELRSSRELCTAGTLTEVSWEIGGGTPPYALSVEGSAVDVAADNVRVICGARAEPPAPDADAALEPKRVTATVTDSRGVQRKASLDVARVRPLPPPTLRTPAVYRTWINTDWVTVGGAHHEADAGWWLIRWRTANDDADAGWTYKPINETRPGAIVIGGFGGLNEGTAYTFAVASLRDPIERMTPDALPWSSESEATTTTTPTGVRATSTHDTITVTWDDQPSVHGVYVPYIRADGMGREASVTVLRDADPPNQATLINLEPETEYRVIVAVQGDDEGELRTPITVTTAAAPADWSPPARGAQNLAVTATHDTITVTWDAPTPNTRDRWIVRVGHPSWPRAYTHWASAPLTFTLEGLTPATTYTVRVKHVDLYGVEVSTTVTTAAAPISGSARRAPLLFEWWADGRPTTPLLYLQLTSSRNLCTAGTPTEISWQIAGSVQPYTLSIEGETVDAAADNVRVICGARAEPPASDTDAALEPKRVTATVTDSRGVQRKASLDVPRARALSPPQRLNPTVQRTRIAVSWVVVDGVRAADRTALYLLRSRPVGQISWNYIHAEHRQLRELAGTAFQGLNEGVEYEAQIATIRHRIEELTPAALTWSTIVTAVTATTPAGVQAVATHDTVTVSWNAQPSVRRYYIDLSPSDSRGVGRLESIDTWNTAIREVTFRNLEPATNYTVTVSVDGDFESLISSNVDITTAPAPENWTPSERRPVIVRTHATHDTIEVVWAAPSPNARPLYLVSVEHPTDPRVYTEWVGAGTTFSLGPLAPETTYTVHVLHQDLHGGKTTIELTTLPLPTQRQEALPAGEHPFWDACLPSTLSVDGSPPDSAERLRK